jgi:hypothetical protein
MQHGPWHCLGAKMPPNPSIERTRPGKAGSSLSCQTLGLMNYATTYPRAWRLFFAFNAALVVSFIGYDIFHKPSGGVLTQIIGAVVGLSSLVPLHGYVWQRAHHPRWLWRSIFWFSVVAIVLGFTAGFITITSARQWSLLLLLAVLMIPGLIYLFAMDQYLNKSPHLWG